MATPIEIICRECGADTLLRREPVYEGFKKSGESLMCAACGYVYAKEEDVPFKVSRKLEVFNDEDRPKALEVFGEDEKRHNCRYCRHYVVNPFIQRCGLHHREVLSTDYCDDFNPPDESKDNDKESEDGS